MKKLFLFALVITLSLASVVFAAVEIKSAGTVIGKTETLNITGPSVVVNGADVNVDFTSLTGDLTVSGDIYSDTGLSVDGSIYLTGGDGMYKPLFLPQDDGGCSACGVADNGTTFSCVDTACPAGMTQ